jgi:phosphate acyltransferase
MRIAVDVMGGDHGIGVVVDGAQQALEAVPGIEQLLLVGREDEIRDALHKRDLNDSRVLVHHASEILTMQDKPMDVLRKKKDCSMARAIGLVKDKRADAVVCLGHTRGGVTRAKFLRGEAGRHRDGHSHAAQ